MQRRMRFCQHTVLLLGPIWSTYLDFPKYQQGQPLMPWVLSGGPGRDVLEGALPLLSKIRSTASHVVPKKRKQGLVSLWAPLQALTREVSTVHTSPPCLRLELHVWLFSAEAYSGLWDRCYGLVGRVCVRLAWERKVCYAEGARAGEGCSTSLLLAWPPHDDQRSFLDMTRSRPGPV